MENDNTTVLCFTNEKAFPILRSDWKYLPKKIKESALDLEKKFRAWEEEEMQRETLFNE